VKISIIVLAAITLFTELIVGLTVVSTLSSTTAEAMGATGYGFFVAAVFAFLAVVLDISLGIIAVVSATLEHYRGWRTVIISSLLLGVLAPVSLFILGLVASAESATNSALDSDFVAALDVLLPVIVPIVAIVYVIFTRPPSAPAPVVVHPATTGLLPRQRIPPSGAVRCDQLWR
jgi:hypothetical protein